MMAIQTSKPRVKGWFIIPGVQDGDRTVEEQVEALKPAIAESSGKTVLDIGCAEGLAGREFALAGARCVFGIDSVDGHIEIARQMCAGLPMEFAVAKLGKDPMPVSPFGNEQFDIVLALGVSHKLRHPEIGINIAAQSSAGLVLLRRGLRQTGGVISSKHYPENTCDTYALMREHGFEMEKVVDGPPPHCEAVEYWRRTP